MFDMASPQAAPTLTVAAEPALADLDRRRLERQPHAIGGDHGVGDVSRQDGDELLAAEAGDDVSWRAWSPLTVEANSRNASSPTAWP